MDTTITAYDTAFDAIDAEGLGRLARWRLMVLRWFQTVRAEHRRRVRPMQLHPVRVLLLGLVIAGASAGLAMAYAWSQHVRAADEVATAALAFVDARLAAIEGEIQSLERQPEFEGATQDCPAVLRAALTRASLSSDLVRHFMSIEHGNDMACQPMGRTLAIDLTLRPSQRLSLTSTGEISSRLMATRSSASGRTFMAVLDSRSMDMPAVQGPAWGTPVEVRVTLRAADGRALAALGVAANGAALVETLRVSRHSQHHAAAVQVDIDKAGLLDYAQRCVLGAWAMVGPAALVLLLQYWRRALQRTRLTRRIELGLRKRQFEPFVQPIVDLATGRCVGGEVLMRWQHPQRGTLAPGEFIDEAERSGLIIGMSDLVMARAAHRLAPLAAAQPELYFSFNVTPAQLRNPRFPQQLGQIFHAGTLPREQVLLELTERDFVDARGSRALAHLRAAGWRIAMDDFGTGHSSLASLEQMRVDRIKIDRAFVISIEERTLNRPVLDSIITLADQLRIALIAEGVETKAQWDYLAQRGVQSAQGYLVARPMPIDAFARWLAGQSRPALTIADVAAQAAAPGPALDMRATQLWEQMCAPGGLDVRDRIYRLRSYPRCFVGREAVDWLVQHQNVSRAEAVRLGQRLAALGLLRHVADEHDFKDAEFFYFLSLPQTANEAAVPAADTLHAELRGPGGVVQKEHARGLLMHRQCVPGRELVGWICGHYRVSRVTAAQWAGQLMRSGALRHIFDDQPMRDDSTLYRVT